MKGVSMPSENPFAQASVAELRAPRDAAFVAALVDLTSVSSLDASAGEAAQSSLYADTHTRDVASDARPDTVCIAAEIELVRAWTEGLGIRARRRATDDARRDVDAIAIASVTSPTAPGIRAAAAADPTEATAAPATRVPPPQPARAADAVVVNVRATREGTIASLEVAHHALGPIQMEITISGSRMLVHATARDTRAVSVLAASEQSLRASVRAHGLELHVLRVSLDRRRPVIQKDEPRRRPREER